MKYELNDIEISTHPKLFVFEKIKSLIDLNKSSLIVTFNLDNLRISTINENFKNVCSQADIVVPDGIGVTSLLRIKHGVKSRRITGNDLFQFILSLSQFENLKYAFIGSTVNVLKIMESSITLNYPCIKEKLFYSPPIKFEESEKENKTLIDALLCFKPDILFLALGCPRQEIWLYENMNKIGAKINIGVGATFDFYSGIKKRAPVFLQKIGLEWLWRLMSEPTRLFQRYLIDDLPFFLNKVRYIVKNKII